MSIGGRKTAIPNDLCKTKRYVIGIGFSMKASELREKTVDELQEDLIGLLKDQFNFRMQKSTGQLGQTNLLKQVSKDIARVKTVLNQKADSGNEWDK